MAIFNSSTSPKENLGFVFYKSNMQLSVGKHILNLNQSIAFPNVMVKADSIEVSGLASFDVQDYSITPNETRNLIGTSNGHLVFSPNGERMFTIDRFSDLIKQYNLNEGATPFDLSSYTQSSAISTPDSFPNGLFFSPTGHRLFELRAGSDIIKQFNLDEGAEPYELNNYTIQSKEFRGSNQLVALHFSPDGKRLFTADSSNDDRIEQFNHTSGDLYELDNYNFEKRISIEVLGTSNISGIHFSPDGQFFHVVDTSSSANGVFQFKLNEGATPFEVENYTFDRDFETGSNDSNLQFAPDGSRMYVNNIDTGLVEQYNFNGTVSSSSSSISLQNQIIPITSISSFIDGVSTESDVSIGVKQLSDLEIEIDVPVSGTYTIGVK